jgi:hypothetical protein
LTKIEYFDIIRVCCPAGDRRDRFVYFKIASRSKVRRNKWQCPCP